MSSAPLMFSFGSGLWRRNLLQFCRSTTWSSNVKWWTQFLGEIPCHMTNVLLLLHCHAASRVRSWHHLMPHHATLKNAYRDRTSRQDAAAQRALQKDCRGPATSPRSRTCSNAILTEVEGWAWGHWTTENGHSCFRPHNSAAWN